MGEAVSGSNSEEFEVGTEKGETTEWKRKESDEEEGGDRLRGGLVKWQSLFPKMGLRVLLVEADDSTRQIITALLKKCSYRVAAVADGLKAWEMLKGRPHNIDLILTEVDLPAISGYALLTLIMEHEICKNIPVIMMSTQDSISTVYKCMMRGASDYLVKPLRRNELRNLWQHVWRRRSTLLRENGPQDESVGQDKDEAASENNEASNHSTGNMICLQRSKEYIEKGSEAQSSCTKPDLKAERGPVENNQDFEQPAWGSFSLNNTNIQNHERQTHSSSQKLPIHENVTRGPAMTTRRDTVTIIVDKDVEPQGLRINANVTSEACNVLVDCSREAIDFMGASTNQYSSSSNVKRNFDSSHLDLSLKRSHPIGFEIQVSEERHTLRHSDASAFTRYTNRSPQTPQSSVAVVYKNKELGENSGRRLSSNIGGYKSDTLSPTPSDQRSLVSLATGQTKESEVATFCPRQRVLPTQIPADGLKFHHVYTSYGSAFPSMFSMQSGASPTPSPSSASQPESTFKANAFHQSSFNGNSEQFYDRFVQNAHDSFNHCMQKHNNKLDSLDDRGHISPATDQSANSSFCEGTASRLNSVCYGSTSGSNSNVDQVAMVMAVANGQNEEGIASHNLVSHSSIQREAALTKFRLKRKDRCYEKKVRYESRKKLAEQRPRVKGQFVRQPPPDAIHSERK